MLKHEDFVSSLTRLNDEKDIREELNRKKLTFGISFLDEALRGIIPTDLIVIGASSGIGKTSLAANIAYKNAKLGQKVYGIFLEAFEGEIELRQKYRLLAEAAKKEGQDPDYAEWINGEQPWLDSYSDRVDYSHFQNVFTKYRGQEYGIDELVKDLSMINDEADLIVIDHLHYFDIEERDENRGMTKIVKKISDLIQVIKRPVVLISHLRKKNENSAQIVPSLDDFHGSSNITKIATKVITLGLQGFDKTHSHTLIGVPKFRLDGSVSRYVALAKFSVQMSDYEPTYRIGTINKDANGGRKNVWEEYKEKPRWFKGGYR